MLAFALGAAWLQTRPQLPPLAWAALLPLGGVLWAALAPSKFPMQRHPARTVPRTLLAWLLAFLTGFFYAAWRAESRLADALPAQWEGRDVAFSGRVVGLPETTPNGLRFVLDVAAVTTPGATLPGRVQIGWYARPGEMAPHLQGGACVSLVARLARPHGSVNPGGFDYQAWLLQRGIRASGSLRGAPAPAIGCAGAAGAQLDALRERLRAHLRAGLGEAPYAGVVIALALGDQDAIPATQWTLFRQTGTTHLFSVSGLHITLFSAMVYVLVAALWRRFPRLCLRLPARRAGIALGLLAATAYTLLSGFGIPAQRTLYMLAAAAAVAWLDRAPTPSRLLAVALAAVVLIDPWAALAPGFWLSFAAVATLLYASMGTTRRRLWRAWAHAQWAVTVALAPLLLVLFHEISLVSPLANAVAIPLVSLLAVPLALLAAVLPWDWCALVAHAVIAAGMAWLELLAALPRPVFHTAAPDWPAFLLALLGTALLLLPRGFPARWLGVLLFLPLFFPRLPAPQPGEAWLTVFDVGQGESVLVRTAGRAVLVDTGLRFASGEDAGSRVVAPALWRQGITRLDGLVVSHDDIDHSGGAASLLASHRPDWLLTSLAGMPPARLSETGRALLTVAPRALACVAGQTWTWDGVRFQVLHPPAHHYAHPGFRDNDRSCVIRIDTAHGSALLTGDIEQLAEMNLAERRMPLAADVLVAPHHGANTSSTPEFLAAVRPRLVVVPVGRRNPFGHPHPEALARYRALGAEIARTDRHGAVEVRLQATGLTLARAVDEERRYWRE
ncbi:MAG: DNA internalization-related competence protein ComEC/Rec2 [bacterium]|nr:MAG: DNA internalization-related competence protein ComEC/Rec2 [bacterium]KAF0148687.1 MAG: DNA internalization-related competence protein ComEC/Rec2 [bacterium]KAF0168177.1 MAG: DNA internalization-related competence protein ComEC/Rec2 [bacterium]TXT19698.1 MAG: DNA internalization-related competence protein ComEC/Rec2 [bacterium]